VFVVFNLPRTPAVYRFAVFRFLDSDPPTLSSRADMESLVHFAKKAKVRILFVQIYRANQAWFPSKVGDTGSYKVALQGLGEDPFAFLIREAHHAGIEVHAWLNLLSLSTNENARSSKIRAGYSDQKS